MLTGRGLNPLGQSIVGHDPQYHEPAARHNITYVIIIHHVIFKQSILSTEFWYHKGRNKDYFE